MEASSRHAGWLAAAGDGRAIEVPGLAAPSMGLEVKAASVTDID
jgi:hypothetical protein